MWDYLALEDWREHTRDPRLLIDGPRLAWCRLCHKIYRKSPTRFVTPTKEVREILTRLGVKVIEKPTETPDDHGPT